MNIDDLVKVEISGSGIILDKEETCSSECGFDAPIATNSSQDRASVWARAAKNRGQLGGIPDKDCTTLITK